MVLQVWPITPGSSAGTRSEAKAHGGHGGGVVTIEATGDVVVDGVIDASGGNGYYFCGGGAGGSVAISCRRLGGSGSVSANGGDFTNTAGAGGGGRIALLYNELLGNPDFTVEAKVFNTISPYTGNLLRWDRYWLAEAGTIYLADELLVTGQNAVISGAVVIPGFARWEAESIKLGSGVNLMLPVDFELSVEGMLELDARSSLELAAGGRLSCGSLSVDGGSLVLHSFTQMVCRADLVVSGGGSLYLYSAPSDGLQAYGAVVEVGGKVITEEGAWIYPDVNITNGAPVRFTAERYDIGSGSGFNATGRGYGGPGSWSGSGSGPGAGVRNNYGTGAGHGGAGGAAYYQKWLDGGGETYGNPLAPVLPGSGGGTQSSGTAGHGGGVIWLEARQEIALSGSLLADGNGAVASVSGGGSGGGILIAAPRIAALTGAVISARGGNGIGSSATACGGAAGGGRVAIAHNVAPSRLAALIAGANVSVKEVETLPAVVIVPDVSQGATNNDYSSAPEFAPQPGTVRFYRGGEGTVLLLR